jgi:hypothetical protein
MAIHVTSKEVKGVRYGLHYKIELKKKEEKKADEVL